MAEISLYRQRAIADSLAREWREEAERRRRVYKGDPVSDILEYCAGELAARALAAKDLPTVTVEEFAATHGVTLQTVRNWCRSGAIPARAGALGWLIERGADAPKRVKVRA